MATVVATFDDSLSRVAVALTFSATVTAVQVVRVAGDGVETVLRSGATFPLIGGTGTIYDYEMPLDMPVSYKATQVTPASSTPESATSGAPQTMPSYGRTWLKDPAQPANNLRLDYVEGLPSINRQARAGVFDIIDRQNPVIVTAKRQSVSGDLTVTTYTQTEYTKMVTLINRGEILLLSTPPAYGFGNIYVHVGDVDEDRVATGDVTNWLRKWKLPLLQVDRPSSLTTTLPTERWIDVRTSWATWNDLYAANLTWDQLKALPAGATSPV